MLNLGDLSLGKVKKMELTVVKVTDENKTELAELAITMYLGEKCVFCGREYKTLADLKKTVWVGQDESRQLACVGCWQKHGQNT
jgi:hypothetical protein